MEKIDFELFLKFIFTTKTIWHLTSLMQLFYNLKNNINSIFKYGVNADFQVDIYD